VVVAPNGSNLVEDLIPKKVPAVERKYSRTIFTGFTLTSLALLVVGVAGLYSIGQVVYRNDLVDHTHLLIESLDRIRLNLKDVENAQETYLISGKSETLETMSAERSALIQEIDATKSLTADNPIQQQTVKALEGAINSRLSFIDQTIMIRQTKGLEAAASQMRSDNPGINDQVGQLIIEMSKEENALLGQRNRESMSAEAITEQITLFGSLAILLFVGLTAVFIHRSLARPHEGSSRQLSGASFTQRYAAKTGPRVS
jgi:CHASE3 domain sensor protein